MKVKALAYQPQNGEAAIKIPTVLDNTREWAIARIADRIKYFGIGKLTIKPVRVGIRTVYDISFRPLNVEVPQDIVNFRNTVVRSEAEFMLSYGVTDMELVLDDNDISQMKDLWAKASQVKSTDANGTANTIQEVPLNVESDPTAKNVLEK